MSQTIETTNLDQKFYKSKLHQILTSNPDICIKINDKELKINKDLLVCSLNIDLNESKVNLDKLLPTDFGYYTVNKSTILIETAESNVLNYENMAHIINYINNGTTNIETDNCINIIIITKLFGFDEYYEKLAATIDNILTLDNCVKLQNVFFDIIIKDIERKESEDKEIDKEGNVDIAFGENKVIKENMHYTQFPDIIAKVNKFLVNNLHESRLIKTIPNCQSLYMYLTMRKEYTEVSFYILLMWLVTHQNIELLQIKQLIDSFNDNMVKFTSIQKQVIDKHGMLIDALPEPYQKLLPESFIKRSKRDELDLNLSCIICTVYINDVYAIITTNGEVCNHINVCKTCIDTLMAQRKPCPSCNKPIKSTARVYV